MKRKALALLLSLILAASFGSVAFADDPVWPATGDEAGLANELGELFEQQPEPDVVYVPVVPVATSGQTDPPETDSESESESSEESQEEQEQSPEDESVQDDPENPDDPQDGENVGDDDLIPDKHEEIDDVEYIPENTGDVFNVRALLRVPFIPQDDPVLPADERNELDNTATNNNGSAWIPVSGIPDVEGATISASTKLVFAIPEDNFATSGTTGGTFASNLSSLNTESFKNKVKVVGTYDYTSYFNVNFITVAATNSGRSYAVELTPKSIPDIGLELPKGTIFAFVGSADPFKLPADLLIASGKSSNSKAIGITDSAWLGGPYTWVTKNGGNSPHDLETIDGAMPGDEFLIHFSPQFFEWSGNTPAKVTLTSIRGKISLRQTGTASSRVFEAVELTSYKGEAVVRIKFRENLTSTKPIDFKTKLYLTVSGKRHEGSSLEMTGTFGDDEPEEFYAENKDIDISDGLVGVAMESMNMVKVYIGDGVTLTVPHIRRNAKFYGAVSVKLDKYDEALFEKYTDLVEVYTLHTLGLNGAGVKVDIGTRNGFYVYDADLNYLGQSTRKLEFSEKYYLAASMLDLEEDENEEDYEPIDGDMPPSQNANKNPGTGR